MVGARTAPGSTCRKQIALALRPYEHLAAKSALGVATIFLRRSLNYAAMHPLNGTWLANIAKSRRHANHQFASATMSFTISGNEVRLSYEGVNASGKPEKSEEVLHADGLPHQHPLAPNIVVTSSLASRGVDMKATKDGSSVGQSSYYVTEDGKTMTATVSGIDGSGKPFEQVIVFDREA